MLRTLFVATVIFLIICNVASGGMIDRKKIEPTGQVIWEVPNGEKVIALTFDDGPNPNYTPQVVDILNEHGAKATFFPIGFRMVQFPNVVKLVTEAGNELGNHTMTHPYENVVGFEKMKKEIARAEEVLQKYDNSYVKLFRPPGGYIDNSLLEEVQKRGYKVILWSYHQDPKDWSEQSAEKIASHVIKNARSGDIVLLHDGGGNRSATVEALKTIIPTLQEKGFKFVTVSELLRN